MKKLLLKFSTLMLLIVSFAFTANTATYLSSFLFSGCGNYPVANATLYLKSTRADYEVYRGKNTLRNVFFRLS